MVVIETLEVKKKYRYLWLKMVSGINLRVHCARCLLGEYSKAVNANEREFGNIELPPRPYYYLCGVRNYHENIHVAFIEAEGELIEIDDERCHLVIHNARRIQFSEEDIDHLRPEAAKREYRTCRNWQFANWLLHNDESIGLSI